MDPNLPPPLPAFQTLPQPYPLVFQTGGAKQDRLENRQTVGHLQPRLIGRWAGTNPGLLLVVITLYSYLPILPTYLGFPVPPPYPHPVCHAPLPFTVGFLPIPITTIQILYYSVPSLPKF